MKLLPEIDLIDNYNENLIACATITIVIAMSATQNVKVAISGGAVPVLAGISVTVVCLLLVPVISKIGRKNDSETSEL